MVRLCVKLPRISYHCALNDNNLLIPAYVVVVFQVYDPV